jgi:hypothetical protein
VTAPKLYPKPALNYPDPPVGPSLLLTLRDAVGTVRAKRVDYKTPRHGLTYRFITTSTAEAIYPGRVQSWTLAGGRAKPHKVR